MILLVLVKPRKQFNGLEKKNGNWQVSIKAIPKDNEANLYLVRYLSEILDLPISTIQIIRGHRSKIKQIEILADERKVIEKLNWICQSSKENK